MCEVDCPSYSQPKSGPIGLRPRLGLSPKTPQAEAGIRIEPPSSVAEAMGTIAAATAAAEPPLEPPAERRRSQGFRVAPQALGMVKTESLYSGVLVFPKTTTPASRKRRTISAVNEDRSPR